MQRRLWRVCTFAQAHLSLRPGTEISCAGSNNDLCTVYKNSECWGKAARATTGILCNHQCVVSMSQKMLPVRCNKNSSIKHLILMRLFVRYDTLQNLRSLPASLNVLCFNNSRF